MTTLARLFIVLGVIFILIGGLVYLLGRFGIQLGRLPGDIRIERQNFTCIFPLATSILLSILLTLGLSLLVKFLNR
jgi:hypothetical protein